jgi:hypothetical protein
MYSAILSNDSLHTFCNPNIAELYYPGVPLICSMGKRLGNYSLRGVGV